jgi:hypothetical protein
MQYTVLHPSYKLEYFQNAEWPDDWIEHATDRLKEQFRSVYAEMDVDNPTSSQATLVSQLYLLQSSANSLCSGSAISLALKSFQHVRRSLRPRQWAINSCC